MSTEYLSAGAHLDYYDGGWGLPVVFLHPTPLDHNYWRPAVERLAGIRAIVPDLRGHGTSELHAQSLPVGDFSLVPDAPVLSMAQYASDIIALLDRIEIPRAVFAGCSVGGYILLELWRHIPQQIQGLAFVCSKPQPDTEAGRAKRAENIARARTEGVAALYDGMTQTLIGATARSKHPGIVPELRSRMTVTPEAFTAVQAGLATRPDSVPTVATITVPVLAIAGGEDGTVTPAEMEALQSAPGGCSYHVFQDAGHFAAYEQPDKVAGLFCAWLHSTHVD